MAEEFFENNSFHKDAVRATTIIYQLHYEEKLDVGRAAVKGADDVAFYSEDFSFLLNEKCKLGSNFAHRFRFESSYVDLFRKEGFLNSIKEIELYLFNGGAAFLNVYIVYKNTESEYAYKLINPGYMNSDFSDFHKQLESFISKIQINDVAGLLSPYGSEDSIINETFTHDVALVRKRFKHTETMERLAYNTHRIIDVSRDFSDVSERDIYYTYGGRDVEKETYRWCCCISSQSASYVYGSENAEISEKLIKELVDEGLPITMLVMYQRSMCTMLKEKLQGALDIYSRYSKRKIVNLKMQALMFNVNGTIAPSQVSRWHNICETYRKLCDMTGIDESLEEIQNKIEYISEEQSRHTSRVWGVIAAIITIVGTVQTVSAIITLIDMFN